jgi:hypothetical protein
MTSWTHHLSITIVAAITISFASQVMAQRGDPPDFVSIYMYNPSESGPDATPIITGDVAFEPDFDGAAFYRPANEGGSGSLLYTFAASDAEYDQFLVRSTFSVLGFDGSFGRITGSRAIDGGDFIPFQTLDVEPGEVNQTLTLNTGFPVNGREVRIRYDVVSTAGDPLGVQLFRDTTPQAVPFEVFATFVPEPSTATLICGIAFMSLLRRRNRLTSGCS